MFNLTLKLSRKSVIIGKLFCSNLYVPRLRFPSLKDRIGRMNWIEWNEESFWIFYFIPLVIVLVQRSWVQSKDVRGTSAKEKFWHILYYSFFFVDLGFLSVLTSLIVRKVRVTGHLETWLEFLRISLWNWITF